MPHPPTPPWPRLVVCAPLLMLMVQRCMCAVSDAGKYSENNKVDLRMFFNLSDALDYFKNDSSELSQRILQAFEVDCRWQWKERGEARAEEGLPKMRRPFVVIEGNHRTSRNVIGMRLARQMRGRYLVHPAPCLQRFSSALPRGTLFRRAFYILSLFAISLEARAHLALSRAVVVNGYWWDMLAFALVQAYGGEAPSPYSRPDLFQLPLTLLHPDIVFFLHFPDGLFCDQPTTRDPQTWKPRLLSLYRQLEGDWTNAVRRPPLVIHRLRGAFAPMTDTLLETIVTNLSSTRDVWFHAPTRKRVNFDYY